MIRGDSEVKSRFMLTTSVYRRCCESKCDGFLKLFVTDEQMKLLVHEENKEVSEPATDVTPDTLPSEQEASPIEPVVTPSESVTQTGSTPDPTDTVTTPTNLPTSNGTTNSPSVEQHPPGTLLVVVLIRMLLLPIDPSLQTHLASLLLSCLQYVDSVDQIFMNLPTIINLFTRFQEDEKAGLFLDKRFSRSVSFLVINRCSVTSLSPSLYLSSITENE